MTHEGLRGRTIVVTGAAGGQGLAAALLLDEAGARVIATDIADAAPALAGTRVDYRRLDVADEAAWRALAADLAAELDGEPLRGLVNNAGITHRTRLGQTERADWDRVLAVNLTGPMLGIQALAPLMGSGSSIVNIGSSAALNAHYPVAYTSSKWGLRGLTHVAATEYGPRGIRVNIVHPGLHRDADDRERARRRCATRSSSSRRSSASAVRTRSRASWCSCCRMPRPT